MVFRIKGVFSTYCAITANENIIFRACSAAKQFQASELLFRWNTSDSQSAFFTFEQNADRLERRFITTGFGRGEAVKPTPSRRSA